MTISREAHKRTQVLEARILELVEGSGTAVTLAALSSAMATLVGRRASDETQAVLSLYSIMESMIPVAALEFERRASTATP